MATKYNKISNSLVKDTPKVITFSNYAAAVQGCMDEDAPQDCLVAVENDGLYLWDLENTRLILLTATGGGGVLPKYVVGDIMQLYGTTAPSDKWLVCDGSTFDTTKYPDLYTLLGSNTVPDLTDCVLRGIGQNGALSAAEQSPILSIKQKATASMGAHGHSGIAWVAHGYHSYSDSHTHVYTPPEEYKSEGWTNGIAYWPNTAVLPFAGQFPNTNIYLPGSGLTNTESEAMMIEALQMSGTAATGTSWYSTVRTNSRWCNVTEISTSLASVTGEVTTSAVGDANKVFEIRNMEVTYLIRAEA